MALIFGYRLKTLKKPSFNGSEIPLKDGSKKCGFNGSDTHSLRFRQDRKFIMLRFLY